MNTLYTVFGVSEDASPEEIKKAFRRLAHVHHPDKGGNAETFKQLNTAQMILLDPAKRREYDRQLAVERQPRKSFSVVIDFGSGLNFNAPGSTANNDFYSGMWFTK